MARTTVDDCLKKCKSHFDLAYYASKRAREIASGTEKTIEEEHDKPVVLALREIAQEKYSIQPTTGAEE